MLGFSTYFFELAGFADSKAFDLGVGVTAIGVSTLPRLSDHCD